MDRWLITKLRNAPRGIAPAVLILLAALIALRAATSYDTGSTVTRGGIVDSRTFNTTGITLSILLALCAVLAIAALIEYLRGHVRASQILLIAVAVLGIPAYLGPTVAAGIALWVMRTRTPTP